MKKRKVLQASFNLEDTFEADLLEYAKTQGDVSKYIKRLIYVDKEGFRKDAPVVAVADVDACEADNDALSEAMDSVSL